MKYKIGDTVKVKNGGANYTTTHDSGPHAHRELAKLLLADDVPNTYSTQHTASVLAVHTDGKSGPSTIYLPDNGTIATVVYVDPTLRMSNQTYAIQLPNKEMYVIGEKGLVSFQAQPGKKEDKPKQNNLKRSHLINFIKSIYSLGQMDQSKVGGSVKRTDKDLEELFNEFIKVNG
tara:strand:- start:551 stop:1075 length:525 start_codon:yes stop_codon:yes gene_type:complete